MVEVEVRAIVNNKIEIIQLLKERGFVNTDNLVQHDIMLDRPDAGLFNSGKKIRIRIENDKAVLTYKGDINKHKDISKRTELNIQINQEDIEGYIDFLSELGYPICFQVKKERIVMKKEDVMVTFDEWPIIGCMMEIEGPENKIKFVAKEVAPEIKFSNYRLKELFKNKMEETGKTLAQLKEEYYVQYQFDLGHIELIVG